MESKELYPFVLMLVMVGLIIGVGVITLDKFGAASADSISGNESVTTVLDTAVAFTSTYITEVTYVGNATDTDCTNYTTTGVDASYPDATCYITMGTNGTADTCLGAYDIEFTKNDMAEKPQVVLASTVTTVGGIASDWLALIVTIAVLAIILTLVIRSFGQRR